MAEAGGPHLEQGLSRICGSPAQGPPPPAGAGSRLEGPAERLRARWAGPAGIGSRRRSRPGGAVPPLAGRASGSGQERFSSGSMATFSSFRVLGGPGLEPFGFLGFELVVGDVDPGDHGEGLARRLGPASGTVICSISQGIDFGVADRPGPEDRPVRELRIRRQLLLPGLGRRQIHPSDGQLQPSPRWDRPPRRMPGGLAGLPVADRAGRADHAAQNRQAGPRTPALCVTAGCRFRQPQFPGGADEPRRGRVAGREGLRQAPGSGFFAGWQARRSRCACDAGSAAARSALMASGARS